MKKVVGYNDLENERESFNAINAREVRMRRRTENMRKSRKDALQVARLIARVNVLSVDNNSAPSMNSVQDLASSFISVGCSRVQKPFLRDDIRSQLKLITLLLQCRTRNGGEDNGQALPKNYSKWMRKNYSVEEWMRVTTVAANNVVTTIIANATLTIGH
ncbi:hypothetical protein Syun_017421 [Stephania yunnanensis]|uniref:Uncharacterized protein n=1 Tax=Stephania yunnanensis TaxID=152371 RepID=A0AAP0J6W6_9MAGN